VPVCASCGHANREGARFCEACGFALSAAPAREKEQRKTVTVLFCDLTGSTALGETLDPERLRGLLAGYFERMKGIVERHGGSVEKFIGDAVMAVFGAPRAHEDDPERGLHAALLMRERMGALNRRWERRVGRPLALHIGVNTGPVVAGRIGETADAAAGAAVTPTRSRP